MRRGLPRQVVEVGRTYENADKDVALGALSKRPTMLFTDGVPAVANVKQAIARLNRAGANLRRGHTGRLLADWSEISGHDYDLLVAMHPLIEAEVCRPAAERCAYDGHRPNDVPVADTLDPGGVPVCDRHNRGEFSA